MRTFFYFYGSKYSITKYYPLPKYDTIIEPFSGSAGFSINYNIRKVMLNEIDPILFGIWSYLIKSTEEEILALPTIITNVDDLELCQEAKWLIGFWLNKGSAVPKKTPSKWMLNGERPNTFWGEAAKHRIAGQIKYIKHWEISNSSFEELENREATWFIDPPYQKSGKHYRYSKIDYNLLSCWCIERKGQVIVCEQDGANWLPFRQFRTIKSTQGSNKPAKSKEVIWTNGYE